MTVAFDGQRDAGRQADRVDGQRGRWPTRTRCRH
jgi:hypothetical protein